MIRLDVEEYCQQCLDFHPDVIPAARGMTAEGEVVVTDTIIQCKYRKRCAGIERYLRQRAKDEAQG